MFDLLILIFIIIIIIIKTSYMVMMNLKIPMTKETFETVERMGIKIVTLKNAQQRLKF